MMQDAPIATCVWLNSMNIHLEADYKSVTTFTPVYAFDGQLIAVELLTHFSHHAVNVVIPQDMLIPQLNDDQRLFLFQSQINSAEKHHAFFQQQGVKVSMKIDAFTASAILESEFISHKLASLNWLELEINETFPGFNSGKDNPQLMALSERFDLSLENYGSGKATSKAVYDNLFSRVKLDKAFIQHNIKRLSFRPFISALLEHVKPHCNRLIVQGVDDLPSLQMIRHYEFDGVQSALFSPVDEEALPSLIAPPQAFLAIAQ